MTKLRMLSSVILFSALSAWGADIQITGLGGDEAERSLKLLEPRLEYIKEREASSWRADDAAFFLKRLLIRRGFAEVEVTPRILSKELIALIVTSGEQYRFGIVKADNETVISPEVLKEYFIQPLVETEQVREDLAPYIEGYIDKGARNVKNFLRSEGYWNAEVFFESEEIDQENKQVHINLLITSGNQLTIAEPSFTGAQDDHKEKLLAKLRKNFIGRKATTLNINRMIRQIESFYEKSGYQFFSMDTEVEHTKEETILSFEIDSGSIYRVNDIEVSGEEKTLTRRIRRYYKKEVGEVYNEVEIDRITTRLINTGAFSSVVVSPVILEDDSLGLIDLDVEVTEAKARTLQTYGGFGTFEGGIFGAGFTDNNFYGTLTKFFIGAELSGRGVLGHVGINEQRVFNSSLDFSARTYLIERFNEGFDVQKFGLETNLTWAPSNRFESRLFWNGEYATSSSSNLSDLELGSDDYFVQRLGVEQIVDFRNSRLLPTDGYHGRLLLETGFISGDTNSSFFRFDFENSYRYSFSPKDYLLARFRVSTIASNKPAELPIDVRLFSGGINSHRGLEERELGPQSVVGSDPLGGEAYWVSSIEYARTVFKPVIAVAFIDAGQLFADRDDFSLDSPSVAIGVGARIDLPIGPVRLEYGYNLNRQSGDPSGTLHFTIGASF